MTEFTSAELDALPENGGWDIVTDRATGHSSYVRKPIRFLVNDGPVLFYVALDGSRWHVGRDAEGQYWKERLPDL